MRQSALMEVLLANPRGFCAGVERAIEIVERALELHGAPIYVRHEIVHNSYVVDDLRAKGAVFVEELDEVPAGGTVIFSAHGVAKAVQAEAERRGLKVFDATCPLVTKVHVEVSKMLREGYEIVMIGHRGHPEAEGTMGQSADRHAPGRDRSRTWRRCRSRRPERLAYVTQTTLSVDDARAMVAALKARFPGDPRPEEGRHLLRHAEPPGRGQVHGAAMRRGDRGGLAQQLELQPAARGGASTWARRPTWWTARPTCAPEWIAGKRRVGVTAGASAPEVLVNELIARLKALGARERAAARGHHRGGGVLPAAGAVSLSAPGAA